MMLSASVDVRRILFHTSRLLEIRRLFDKHPSSYLLELEDSDFYFLSSNKLDLPTESKNRPERLSGNDFPQGSEYLQY